MARTNTTKRGNKRISKRRAAKQPSKTTPKKNYSKNNSGEKLSLSKQLTEIDFKSRKTTILRDDLRNGTVQIPVLAQIKVGDLQEQVFRSGQDLLLIIDKSGSMSGNKITLVKQTILFIIDQLEDEDRLGLVTFSCGVEILAPLTIMNAKNKTAMKKKVNSIRAGGSTNITAGLKKGFQILKNIGDNDLNENTTVYFLSDGQATCGIRGAGLKKLMNDGLRSISKNLSDCCFHSFGYGAGHDEKLLSEISNISKGKFYYVKDVSFLDQCILDCFGNTISICGKDAKADISFNRGIKILKVYEDEINKNSNTNATIEVGKVMVGKSLNFLIDISIKASKANANKDYLDIGTMTMTYEMGDQTIIKQDQLRLEIVDLEIEGEPIDFEIEEQIEKKNGKTALVEARNVYRSKGQAQAEKFILDYFNGMSMNDHLRLDFKYAMLQNMNIENVKDEKNFLQAQLMFENNTFNPQFGNFSKQNAVQLKLNEKVANKKP